MDIDLVYLYVNGNDEKWYERRKQYMIGDKNANCRFRDNGELLFSLRSVDKYVPWIRNIYIVTDSEMPDWFDASDGRIHVIDHKTIMPEEILPCYNSNVIESYLYNIPGLSEIFLYLNDDCFFGNYVSQDFFVKDGKPVTRMVKEHVIPDTYYKRALYNSVQLMKSHFNIEYDLVPWHNAEVFSKTEMENCIKEFQNEFDAARKQRLRSDQDIQKSIFQYYMISRETCTLKIYERYHGLRNALDFFLRVSFPKKFLDYADILMDSFVRYHRMQFLLSRKPKVACINDSEGTTEEDTQKYKELMQKFFPKKSPFEK